MSWRFVHFGLIAHSSKVTLQPAWILEQASTEAIVPMSGLEHRQALIKPTDQTLPDWSWETLGDVHEGCGPPSVSRVCIHRARRRSGKRCCVAAEQPALRSLAGSSCGCSELIAPLSARELQPKAWEDLRFCSSSW